MMKTNDKNPRRFELPEVIFKWECNRHVSQHKGSAVGKWGSKVGSEENEGSVVGNHLRDQHDCVFFIKDLETTPNKQSDWLVYERLLLFIALCLLFGIFLTITLSLISDILLLLGDYMVFLKLFFTVTNIFMLNTFITIYLFFLWAYRFGSPSNMNALLSEVN